MVVATTKAFHHRWATLKKQSFLTHSFLPIIPPPPPNNKNLSEIQFEGKCAVKRARLFSHRRLSWRAWRYVLLFASITKIISAHSTFLLADHWTRVHCCLVLTLSNKIKIDLKKKKKGIFDKRAVKMCYRFLALDLACDVLRSHCQEFDMSKGSRWWFLYPWPHGQWANPSIAVRADEDIDSNKQKPSGKKHKVNKINDQLLHRGDPNRKRKSFCRYELAQTRQKFSL